LGDCRRTQEDRAIHEAQPRRRHLPAGQRLRHRDPSHHDVLPLLAALSSRRRTRNNFAGIARDMNDQKVVAVYARPGSRLAGVCRSTSGQNIEENRANCKAIGITCPLSLLARANEVIE